VSEHAGAIYSQTGGCRVGRNYWLSFNATWPFAGIFVYPDELVLSTFLRRYRFARRDISQITRYNFLFSHGLRIEHTVESYPRFVVFWTWNTSDLEDALYANAFPVAAPSV
jgi:hypothetical protein